MTMPRAMEFALAAVLLILVSQRTDAKDYFLTIGGGNAPSSNQASLERNVLFLQRLLQAQHLQHLSHDIYFADGNSPGKDLQVKDLQKIPKANRLMAEFFGTEDDLAIFYRNHQIENVRAATGRDEVSRWFQRVGTTMGSGDRLILYVTAHGEESDDSDDPYDTSILLWNDQQLTVRQLVDLLDQLPDGVQVVSVMVQCHAGGFAKMLYEGANPRNGLSKQRRCGFFATLHDRISAGCTAEVNEASYVEYSTYFWEALGGRTCTGEPIESPDYDHDGLVSFEEAHAYTVLNANTIDIPIRTSGEFLLNQSRFGGDQSPALLAPDAGYATVLKLSTAVERAVLEGLSAQLQLAGENRIATARNSVRPPRRGWRRRFRNRRARDPAADLRDEIVGDLQRRWPALANVLNPGAVELVTTRSHEFVEAVEQHPAYPKYRRQVDQAAARADPSKQRARFARFVRTAENVILRENLERLGDGQALAEYEAIVAAERGGFDRTTPTANAGTPTTR